MSAHAPAPWMIRGRAGVSWHGVVDASGRLLCTIRRNRKQSNEERDANARLMAAAPRMLAALELAFPVLDGISNLDGEAERARAWATLTVLAALTAAKKGPA